MNNYKKKNYLFFVFLLPLLIFSHGFAQSLNKPTELDRIKIKINMEIEARDVEDLLRKCNALISEYHKDNKAVPLGKYALYGMKIDYWVKYKWFIADTGLSRKWLQNVYNMLKYLQKTQDIIQTAKYNRTTNTPKYEQAVKYYDVAYERFVKLIKKPVRVSSKVQRRAKLNKALWQKSMRKKYKIDKKSETDFL